LRLAPGQAYTEEFFGRGFPAGWGVVLASSAPSRELRRHLRRFLRVRSDGRILGFRYYDPRVLQIYLPTCTPAETAAFFGPVQSIAAPGRGGELTVFRPAQAEPQPWSGMLWTIRAEQMQAMAEARREQMIDRCVEFVRGEFPDLCARMTAAQVRDSVRTALAKGERWKFGAREEVMLYLELMYLLGFDFDESRRGAWARGMLGDFDLGPRTRLELLVDEARARVGRKRRGTVQ
jgi:Domain of unknown function (DUF4123)